MKLAVHFLLVLAALYCGMLTMLQGVSVSPAQQKYMELLSDCPAYASTFFEAEYVNKDQRFPRDMWLAVNGVGVQIYQRGAVAPIQRYAYGQ